MKKQRVMVTDVKQLPAMLSRADVANLAGVDPRTVYSWLRNGEVPGAVKQGGKWLVDKEVLLAAWRGNGAAKKPEVQTADDINGVAV